MSRAADRGGILSWSSTGKRFRMVGRYGWRMEKARSRTSLPGRILFDGREIPCIMSDVSIGGAVRTLVVKVASQDLRLRHDEQRSAYSETVRFGVGMV